MAYLKQNRLWQGLLLLFLLHQFLEKGLELRNPWVDSYLDDLLCMPILLGAMLGEQMDLFNRKRLSLLDVSIGIVLVSLLFEWYLPGCASGYTADVNDVFCYVLGGLFFFIFMNPTPNGTKNEIGRFIRNVTPNTNA